jgi:CheY-like chemotaxis protein
MPGTRTILIVEDEPLIAMMLEDFLDALGHTVAASCDNVADALGQVERGSFDVAILDVRLKDGEQIWPVADALADAGLRPAAMSSRRPPVTPTRPSSPNPIRWTRSSRFSTKPSDSRGGMRR